MDDGINFKIGEWNMADGRTELNGGGRASGGDPQDSQVRKSREDYYNEKLLAEIRDLQPVNDEGREYKGNDTGARYVWAASRNDDGPCRFVVRRFARITDLRDWVDEDPENRTQVSSKFARKIVLNAMQRSGWREEHPKWMWHGVYYAGLGEIFQEYQKSLPESEREPAEGDHTEDQSN